MKQLSRKDKPWTGVHAVLPYADINDNSILIHNVRNFIYRSAKDFTPGYYDAEYKLSELKKVYFIHVPFAPKIGAAHTFLSFEFENNKFVAISIEARRLQGEEFNPFIGLTNHYELMYVVADERDAIFLRTNHHRHPVYIFPLKDEFHHSGQLFRHMIERMNKLHDKPEYYNTLTNNCTNGIAYHINELLPKSVPLGIGMIFTKFADKHLFDIGVFDTTEKNFSEFQKAHQVNALAETYADSPDFSLKIRGR